VAKRSTRGGGVKLIRSPPGGCRGSRPPDRGRRVGRAAAIPLQCEWERRLSAEGMPDPDRVVIQTSDGPRMRLRRFPSEGGSGGRARIKSGASAKGRGLAIGRATAAEVRLARARVDLRRRRFRRRKMRAGRMPKVFGPGVRRAILDMHAHGYGYRAICRELRLGVSYGTVRRVMLEILEAIRRERWRERLALAAEGWHSPTDAVADLAAGVGDEFLRWLRGKGFVGVANGDRPSQAELERLARDPVIADLLREDRREIWDRMLDGHPGS
jgi:hypothetical protein